MTINIKAGTLFAVIAAGGMIVTACLAAKNAPDAQKKKEEALKAKREKTGDENAQLTFVESVKAQIGSYIPAIVSGTVTLGSLFGSDIINKENLKKAEKAFSEYKDMTDHISGTGTSNIIERAVEQKKIDDKNNKSWSKKDIFRIVFQGQTIEFESTRDKVIQAFYETNRLFQGKGIVTFNEFLGFLDQQIIDDKIQKEGDRRGWEMHVGEAVYGYSWIDFGLNENKDEPWVTEIYFPVYPHLFDEDEAYAEIDDGCTKKLESCIRLDEQEHPTE